LAMGVNLLPIIWSAVTLLTQVTAAPQADLIGDLPGVNFDLNYDQYSGYLDGDTGVHLHYWFVESQSAPSTDPLVLWLTGGPGCSSLDALLQENGPIHIYPNGSLYDNQYAWNKIANVLYLESPVWVGFSYADRGHYSTDDDTTSLNNYLALQSFLENFPEYSGREFYIAGESYAGIYVPTLAVRVLNGNLSVNFQGIAIGNPVLSDELNDNSIMFYGRYHGLIGESTWESLVADCCGGVESQDSCDFSNFQSLACTRNVLQAENTLYANDLNPYDILSPCESDSEVMTPAKLVRRRMFRKLKQAAAEMGELPVQPRPKRALGSDPECIDATYVSNWLNQDDVRTALHISDQALDWTLCSDVVSYSSQYDDMTSQFNELLPSVRALIYNGDFDTVCNFLGDQWFVESLGREVVSSYNYWTDSAGVVAGYGKAFDSIQFTTVRGSGHLVPQDQPERALALFTRFLNNESF